MAEKPRYRMVIASDRYEFDWEANELAEIQDMELDLSGGAVETEDELISIAHEADALLISSREAINSHVLTNLTKCKVISRRAVGLDHIDLDTAAELGIVITHSPDYCTNEVADRAFAFVLTLNRRIVEYDQDLRNGAWTNHQYMMDRILRGPIHPLREQTLGIVGLGRIGK